MSVMSVVPILHHFQNLRVIQTTDITDTTDGQPNTGNPKVNPNEHPEHGPGRPRTSRSVAMAERKARAVELRRSGLTFESIAAALGCSRTTAFDLVKSALRSVVATPAQALLEQELAELELARTRTLAIIDAQHRVVSAGSIVTEDALDPTTGAALIDERTGKPFKVPLHNPRPVIEAIRLLLSIAESRRALLGADAPKKVSLTDPDGNPTDVLRGMDAQRIQAALEAGLARLRAPAAEVVDVVPVERNGGDE